LDRCNPKKKERKYWIDLANTDDIWCIHFDVSKEECIWRIKNRKNHETVTAERGPGIVKCQNKMYERPELDEGFKNIIRVQSFKESNVLLLKIGCDLSCLREENYDHIMKFPRTKHLVNLGSATRDDLLVNKDVAKEFLNKMIYLEEKIDGANMGISIKDNKIVVQNRSHYVSSSYHQQFKLLDTWIYKHSSDLWTILKDDSKILFGEWVYAKHSIHYTNLPDYFVAFDIYDKIEKRFYSRYRLEKVLKDTEVSLIPLIKKAEFVNLKQISDLVGTKSQFYDGPIEGIYVRICNDKWLVNRSKIVRHDFLSGNDHWSKGIMTRNTVSSEFLYW
jgi:atypical dual specificity phosphatase